MMQLLSSNEEIIWASVVTSIKEAIQPDIFFSKSGQLEKHLINGLVTIASIKYETIIGSVYIFADMAFALD